MNWYQVRWAQKYWGKETRERYQRYLQSDAWKTKRKNVLQAAGFRCRKSEYTLVLLIGGFYAQKSKYA